MLCSECGASIASTATICPWCRTVYKQNISKQLKSTTLSDEQFILPLIKFPPFTAIILLIQFILFGLMEWYGGSSNQWILAAFGAKLPINVMDNEYWRLVSANFLHIGWAHLICNSFTLIQLGLVCENLYGSMRFFILYLLSGVSGFLASLYFADALSAGASASLFGLMGAIITFGWRYHLDIPKRLRPHFTWYLIPWIVGMIAFGIYYENIDNWAHIGGLFSGIICAFILVPKLAHTRHNVSPWPIRIIFTSLIIALSIFFWQSSTSIKNKWDLMLLAKGERTPQDDVRLISKLISSHPDYGMFYYFRGESYLEQDNFEQASKDFLQAYDLDYRSSDIENAIGWSIGLKDNPSEKEIELGIAFLNKALKKDDHPAYHNTIGWLYFLQKDYNNSILEIDKSLALNKIPSNEHTLDLYMLSIVYKTLGKEKEYKKYFSMAELEEKEINTIDKNITRFKNIAKTHNSNN